MQAAQTRGTAVDRFSDRCATIRSEDRLRDLDLQFVSQRADGHAVDALELGAQQIHGVDLPYVAQLRHGEHEPVGDAARSVENQLEGAQACYATGSGMGAVFTALSTWVKHAVIIGALYLVLWEGMLIGLAPRARFLSLHHGALAVAEKFRGARAMVDLTDLSTIGGVMVLGIALVAGFLLAWWALSRMRLAKGS